MIKGRVSRGATASAAFSTLRLGFFHSSFFPIMLQHYSRHLNTGIDRFQTFNRSADKKKDTQ